MPKIIGRIQESWPHIRINLYKCEDNLFQFIEEGLRTDETGAEVWLRYHEFELFNDLDTAKAAMMDYYCNWAEDEYVVDPASVTILEPPDFNGPHHPKLTVRGP